MSTEDEHGIPCRYVLFIGLALIGLPAVAHAQQTPALQSSDPAAAGSPGSLEATAQDTEPGSESGAGAVTDEPHGSLAPAVVLDRVALEASGQASLGDVLQELPLQSNAVNAQVNRGGDGTTRIALRGLGAERTLVLVNGRRHVSGGTGTNGSVDMTAIPLAVVERVEVFGPGGAPVHGAGAIGGVVNIVTRTRLDGTEAAAYMGTAGAGGGTVYDVSVATGIGTERAHLVLAAGYHDQQPIGAGERDFSRFDYDYDWETREELSVGSTAVPQGIIVDYYDPANGVDPRYEGNQAWQDLRAEGGACARGFCYNDPQDGWRDFNGGGTSDVGEGDYYNYQPESHLLTPRQRHHLFSTGTYALHDRVRGFFEASYSNRQSEQKLAPTPLLTITEGIVVAAENAYNPFDRDFEDVRRRMVEAGNRRTSQDVDTLRLLAGLEGTLPAPLALREDWRWSLAYGYGRTSAAQENRGDLVRSRLASALGPSFMDTDGTYRCGTPDNPGDPACVPLNLFGGVGTITPEMLDYVTHTGTASGTNELHQVTLDTMGTLLALPRGGGVALHAGAAYRKERGDFTPDSMLDAGNSTGTTTPAAAGSFDATEAYGALTAVPLAGVPMAERLALHGAVRVQRHSTAGIGSTWELGSHWRIIDGLSVRGTWATAFRTPSIRELYASGGESFPRVSDPCDTLQGFPSPAAQAACAAEGIPDDFSDPRTQLRVRTGGNPDVEAETAGILTVGTAYEPIPGLALTAGYFHIALDDQIQPAGAATLLADCYGPSRSNCDRIQRDPDTNLITVIDDLATNTGGIKTSGMDLGLHYRTATPAAGRVRLDLLGTWLHKYNRRLPSGGLVEGKGVYDLGAFPAWKLNTAAQWARDPWGAGVALRYIAGFKECDNNDCSSNSGFEETRARAIDASVTADLFASYTLRSSIGTSRLTLGVRNVLDQAPRKIYNSLIANSEPSAYDFRGRYIYARFAQRF